MYWLLESEPVEVAAFSLPAGKQGADRRKQHRGELPVRGRFGRQPDLLHRGQPDFGRRARGGVRRGMGAWSEDFKRVGHRRTVRQDKVAWWAEKGYAAQMRRSSTAFGEGKAPEVTVRDGARATIGVPAHAGGGADADASSPLTSKACCQDRARMRVVLLGP